MDGTAGARRWVAQDRVVDAGLVAFAAVIGYYLAGNRAGLPWTLPQWALYLDHAAGAVGCLALYWRRRFPRALTAGLLVLGTFSETVSAAAYAGLFTVVVQCSARSTVAIVAASLLSSVVFTAWRPPEPAVPLLVLVPSVLAVHVAVVVWGVFMRGRRRLLVSLRDRAEAAEVEARLRAAGARHEAREALARDVHDVLGSRLSQLREHADALARHRDGGREEVAAAARTILDDTRRALRDLREVVGVLRAPERDPPAPGSDDTAGRG